jgi:predicted Zn-dependent peptidase
VRVSLHRFGWALAAWAALLASPQAGGAEPGTVSLPPVERATLGNGAEVALIARRDTPLISMTVLVRGGALGDAAGKDGTAALFAELIQKGAGSRDAAQFADAIESAGGALSAAAGSESLLLSASFLSRDAGLMVELVADALQRPRLAPDEFEKARTLAVQSIVAAKDSDPRALMGSYGDAWLLAGHPYGRAVGGSEATLAAVTLDDVRRYYDAHVGGDRLIITAVGDFDPAVMRDRLERAFGGWRKASAGIPPLTAPAPFEGRKVLLVDKPGATQTYFWIGNVGASRTDPARTAQEVFNTVFGGRFTSMLNTELRVKSGLTYGARSQYDRGTQPGAFSIASYTKTESTVAAIDLALATLGRLHADGIDEAALASSRNYLLGQFPPTLETNGQLAGRLADMVFHGLGPEDVDGFAARVKAVDSRAARAAIDGAFPRGKDLAFVLIGDAAKIRTDVARYGTVTEMKISDPRFAPLAR